MPWFRPKLPISEPARAWVDRSMEWLVETFGEQRLRSAAVALPTPESFPHAWDGTEAGARATLEHVCELMQVDAARLKVGFFEVERIADEIRALLPHWEES